MLVASRKELLKVHGIRVVKNRVVLEEKGKLTLLHPALSDIFIKRVDDVDDCMHILPDDRYPGDPPDKDSLPPIQPSVLLIVSIVAFQQLIWKFMKQTHEGEFGRLIDMTVFLVGIHHASSFLVHTYNSTIGAKFDPFRVYRMLAGYMSPKRLGFEDYDSIQFLIMMGKFILNLQISLN